LTATNEGKHFKLSTTTTFPKLQAERLIKQLNLFPKYPYNHRDHHENGADGFEEPRLVEWRFKISELGLDTDSETTVENLGHHAGYYRLPHSKDARCVIVFCVRFFSVASAMAAFFVAWVASKH